MLGKTGMKDSLYHEVIRFEFVVHYAACSSVVIRLTLVHILHCWTEWVNNKWYPNH